MAREQIVIAPPQDEDPRDTPQRVHTVHLVKDWINRNYNIRYNTMSNQLQCQWKGHKTWNELSEDYVYMLLREAGISYSLNNLKSLLKVFRETHKWDPLYEYLEGLKWDGKERIDDLADHIKAEDRDRFNKHFKKHLVRTIACALEPNVFNKHCLVLVHRGQSSGKSSFMKWLCPPELQEYYTEEFGHGDKDDLSSLAENLIINLDELSVLGRKDLESLKATFTKTKVKIRLPYDARKSNLIRRCSFWGSSNRDNFLVDDQNVRWLCFRITGIDFGYGDYRNRKKGKFKVDDIWAEAYHLYKNGFEYELTASDIQENEEANEEFKSYTPEQEFILRYFSPSTKDEPSAEHMSATEILENVLERIPERLVSKFNARFIGQQLAQLGFEKKQKKVGNVGKHGYYVIKTLQAKADDKGIDLNSSVGDDKPDWI